MADVFLTDKDKTEILAKIEEKANKSELNAAVSKDEMNQELEKKADKTEIEQKLEEKADKTEIPTSFSTTYSAAVTTSWSKDTTTGAYSQKVTVTGIKSTDNPIVDIVLGNDVAENALKLKAWECVDRITTANGSITLYAYSKQPETAFNIQLKVVR